MGKKSLEVGNTSEKKLTQIFKDNGFWAHRLAKADNGSQPFDIIAVKKNIIWMVDSKHTREENASFPFSDIQPNQIVAMDYAIRFADVNSGRVGFVIFFERDALSPRFLPYSLYCQMTNIGKKSVTYDGLMPFDQALVLR